MRLRGVGCDYARPVEAAPAVVPGARGPSRRTNDTPVPEGRRMASGQDRVRIESQASRQDRPGEPERTLATLLSNLPGMAYRCRNDPDWTMEFVSDGARDLTGYPPHDLIESRRVAYASLIHPDDRDNVWRQVQDALTAGRPFQFIYRLQDAAGELRWVWEQGRAVATLEDGLLAIEGLVMDITEQRRLEDGVAASERRFRALYESANDAIFLIRDGVIVDCNPATEEIFGRNRDEVLGQSPQVLSPPQQPDGRTSEEVARTRMAAALAGERQVFDWKHTKQDGTPFDAEVSLSCVDIDGTEVLLAIVRDVTERVQAYELLEARVEERTSELRATEARYRDLFERSRDAVFIAAHAHFVDVNPAALEVLGARRDEVIGRHVDEFLAPGERERINTAGYEADGAVKDFEIVVHRPDGQQRDCLLTGHTYTVGGDELGFEGILRDITEWKRTEEDLFDQTRESAVLDERNRMAREIHDTIAQGLTGVVLQLEAAEQAAEAGIREVDTHLARAKSLARESLHEARRSVWNLAPQVLQDGGLVPALEREVRRLQGRGSGHAALTLAGAPRELPDGVDIALLRICQEALMNVRKYAQARRVQVTLDYQADAVRLSVEDDGVGFATASGAVRNGAPSKVPAGGFGLISMEQRARQLGGAFSVVSELGRGTRVEVVVPVPTGATGEGAGASEGGSR